MTARAAIYWVCTWTSGRPAILFLLRHDKPCPVLFAPGSTFDDPLPRQDLRDHEMGTILVIPVAEMTGDASDQGNVVDLRFPSQQVFLE